MSTLPSIPGPVALVGAGAVAGALGPALCDAGLPVRAVLSRSGRSAEALAARLGAAVASDRLSDLPADVRLVVLCVPDAAVAPVAAALADLPHAWRTTVAAHTAGALGADVLAPLAERGAAALAFHPVQTFAPGAGAAALRGIYVGLGGTPAALDVGIALAGAVGARHVVIPDEARALYHLAAAVASNFFVVLLAVADEVLAATGVPREEATALLRPLVESTWANLQVGRPEEVLTGPVARGDARTVAAHLSALAGRLPHLVPAYGVLAAEAVRVAVRGAHVEAQAAGDVLEVIQDALDGTSEGRLGGA